MLLFQLIKFLSHFVYFGLNLSPGAWRVNGNASSILNKISCHCCCVKLFMLLARNFSSNNAVESFFQSLLDLGGAGGAV